MSIASKSQTIYTGCADIREAIREEDSTKGGGLITTLGDQIRALFARRFVYTWNKENIYEDDGEGGQSLVGTNYTNGRLLVTGNRLPDKQFLNNTSLISVNLPATITEIGSSSSNNLGQCFSGCSNLEYINAEKITKLGYCSFKGTALRDIKLLNLQYIHTGGIFYGCTKLVSATISGPITSLNSAYSNGTFRNCTSLKTVYLDGSNIVSIGRECFEGCSALTTVSGIENIKTFGQDAFYGCTPFGGFTLTEATSIGLTSFAGCRGDNFYLGNKVTTISNEAFCQATSTLNDSKQVSLAGVINLPLLTSLGAGSFANTKITEIQSLGNISSLPAAAGYSTGTFKRCVLLTTVHLPAITSIGNVCFADCSALETVTIDGSTSISVGNYAFSACTSLTTFPFERISYLGDYAFQYCYALVDDGVIDIPNCTSVGAYCAFRMCTGLTGTLKLDSVINLTGVDWCPGNNIARFHTYSFMSIQNLSSTNSNRGSFNDNTYLQKIILGPNAVNLGNRTFQGCTNLMTVVLYAETPPTIYSTTFYATVQTGGPANRKYYVPYSSDHSILNAYQTATNWSSFASQIYELTPDGEIPE